MSNFIRSKRPQLIILIGFLAAYLIVFTITTLATSLKVIEFAFLTIAFGFVPAYYFRSVFQFRNIVGWILHASVLGLLFIPFLFLFLGWLKINLIFKFSVPSLYLFSIIGLFSLFFLAEDEEIDKHINCGEIYKIDILILFIFLAFSGLLTLQNFNDVYIHWDVFKFWGLDAKYIYEQNQLRDIIFHTDVMIHRYTSFHPIYYSIIYDIYGGIYEQYASWINIYINLLALLLIYGYILDKGKIQKLILSAIMLIVSFAAIPIMKMFSMYADITSAFLLLGFFLILVDATKKTPETYWRRIFLLLLIAISFYFIKSHFIYFTLILIVILVLFDWKFFSKQWTIIIRKRGYWFAIFSIILLLSMRFVYFSNIGGVSGREVVDPSFIFQAKSDSITSFIEYFVELLEYMIHNSAYILGLWWLTLCSILFVKQISKNYIFIFLSSILIFLMPVASYTLRQFDLQSGSLPRYSAIVMYLFPLAISFVHIERDKWKNIVSMIIFVIVLFHVFLNIAWPMPLKEKFSISNGTLQSVMTKYDQFTEQVIEITGPDARVLTADDISSDQVTNMLVPSIFIQYFMMYNSVGSQYIQPISRLYDYAIENNADYILLLSYANSFDHCETLFMQNHDYLIDLRKGNVQLQPESCMYSNFDIHDLGEAIK
jgi:hypothetical protein